MISKSPLLAEKVEKRIKREDHHIEKNSNWEDFDKNAAGKV